MVLYISSRVSPRPSMMPDFVRFPASRMCLSCSRLRLYFACGRTARYSRSTVSILCETTSCPASIIRRNASQSPFVSGIKVSMVVAGFSSFVSATVWCQISAPLSPNSSRLTEVMTACFTFILEMASATRRGSSTSYSEGFPVATAQNVQLRVHTFPKIIKVAVPAPQHSPMFGQLPLSQMVCNLCLSTNPRTFAYDSPVGSFTRNQSGLRGFISVTAASTSLLSNQFFILVRFQQRSDFFFRIGKRNFHQPTFAIWRFVYFLRGCVEGFIHLQHFSAQRHK